MMRLKQTILGSLFSRAAYFFSVFVLNIVVARYFNAAGSGWIYYITSYFSLIILLASFSLEAGLAFFAASKTIDTNKLAWFALLWSIAATLIITLLLFLLYKEPSPLFNRTEFVYFSGFYVLGILLTTFFGALFYANHQFALPGIVLTSTNALLILVASVFSVTHKTNANQIFLELFFLNYLFQGALFAAIYCIKNDVLNSWSLPRIAELRILFKYAALALVANLAFFLLCRIDYWFIKNRCVVCSHDDLGNYIQASKLGQVFLLLPSAIATVLFPRTAAGFGNDVNTQLPVLCRVLLVIYLVLMLPLIASGKWLFPLVFGGSFNNMYIPFLLLMPGLLALSSVAFISAYYAGKNKVFVNLKASFLALIIVITGDIFFVPAWGINAAAAVSAVAYISCYVFVLFEFRRDYAAPIKAFFIPSRGDFRAVYSYVVHQVKDTQ